MRIFNKAITIEKSLFYFYTRVQRCVVSLLGSAAVRHERTTATMNELKATADELPTCKPLVIL